MIITIQTFFAVQLTATDAKSVYAGYFKKQFDPIEKKLTEHYKTHNSEHPTDAENFNKILAENGVVFEDLRDPWGQQFWAVFEVEKTNDVLRIISAGADKKFDTDDDFTVSSLSFLYFTPTANTIDKAVKDFHARTGGYIRDEKTLFQELGITELKDRFNRPYQIGFSIEGRNYRIRIWSLGKNGTTGDGNQYDDFEVHSNYKNYFLETELRINQILQNTKKTPMAEAELKSLLKQNGVDLDEIRDGWGEKIYFYKRDFSRYENVYKEETVSEYGKEGTTTRKVITPVTRGFVSFTLRSKGADKKEATYDDFTLAEFAKAIWEQSKDDEKPKPIIKPISFSNAAGSISGTVTDSSGAVVAGATVTATNTATSDSRSTTTNENGKYLIGNLTAGTYNLKVDASGFKSWLTQNVPVTADGFVKYDVALEVGTVSETVNVTGDVMKIETSVISDLPKGTQFSGLLKIAPGARAESLAGGFQVDGASGTENVFVIDGKEFVKTLDGKFVPLTEKSTPKLREYFPETLVWQPELITDKDGKAQLTFKMADSITTWKLYTIASTKNGKFGVAEKEVTAFQPFFVDLDPPKFLTEGDEIYLPTQVRNYTPTKQKVDVTMSKSNWFSFLTPELQKIEVDKNAAKNAVFGVQGKYADKRRQTKSYGDCPKRF